MRRIVLIVIGLVAAAALALSFYTLSSRNESDTPDVNKVARDAGGSDTQQQDRGLRPTPGTYVYRGSGGDSVDILGGSKHTYGREIPLVVELGDGCAWSFEETFVKQHVETHRFCTDESGVTITGFSQRIEFFRATEKVDLKCGDGAFRVRREAKRNESWTYSCTDGKRTLEYTATYLGRDRVTVGASKVPAWHLRFRDVVSGVSEGTDTMEYWYAASGLPLKWTTDTDLNTDSVLGRTHYTDHASYTLSSTTPR